MGRIGLRIASALRLARFGAKAAAEIINRQIVDFTEPRSRLAHCGKAVYFDRSCSFRSPENVWIGDFAIIGPHNRLWASPAARLVLEDHVLLGPNVTIVTSNHGTADRTVPIVAQPWVESDVVLGRGCWIGANVVILPGVSIGEGAVLAAGAIANASIPAFAIAAGVPAKVIKFRG